MHSSRSLITWWHCCAWLAALPCVCAVYRSVYDDIGLTLFPGTGVGKSQMRDALVTPNSAQCHAVVMSKIQYDRFKATREGCNMCVLTQRPCSSTVTECSRTRGPVHLPRHPCSHLLDSSPLTAAYVHHCVRSVQRYLTETIFQLSAGWAMSRRSSCVGDAFEWGFFRLWSAPTAHTE